MQNSISTPNCNICSSQQKSTLAEIWCLECEESLCCDCSKHHAVSKGTRKHNTISITEYKLLPDFIFKVKKLCSMHNEPITVFCQNHACTGCMTCALEQHKYCSDICKIEDAVTNAKKSIAFTESNDNLSDVLTNIGRLEIDRKENLAMLQEQKKQIEIEVTTFRAKINKHLDKMQKEITDDLNKAEKSERDKIDSVLKSLSAQKSAASQLWKSIIAVKKHATDLQAFLFMEEIENFYEKACQKLRDMKDAGDFNNAKLIHLGQQPLNDVISINFGEIATGIAPSNVELIAKKENQAQLPSDILGVCPIDTLSFSLIRSIETGCKNSCGCVLLPCGESIFTCYDEGMVSFVGDGTGGYNKTIKCVGARDIAYNDKANSIVVSSGDKKKDQLAIIDLTYRRCIKDVKKTGCETDIYGVVVKEDKLIYCARDEERLNFWYSSNGICELNLANNNLYSYKPSYNFLLKTNLPRFSYVTEYRDKLYFTNNEEHSVTCCGMTGIIFWIFKNDALKCPLGVTVDNHANVYVVYKNSANVVVISPNGQRHKVVLSASDGLIQPQVLHYQRSTNQLLVANKEEKAFVFDVC